MCTMYACIPDCCHQDPGKLPCLGPDPAEMIFTAATPLDFQESQHIPDLVVQYKHFF